MTCDVPGGTDSGTDAGLDVGADPTAASPCNAVYFDINPLIRQFVPAPKPPVDVQVMDAPPCTTTPGL